MKPVALRDARKSPVPTSVFDLPTSCCMVPKGTLVDEERRFNACVAYNNDHEPIGSGANILLAYRAGSTTDWNHRIVVTRGTLTEDSVALEDPGLSTYATLESSFGWPGLHTEDPRLCWVPSGAAVGASHSSLFLVYTDGSNVGVGKLDPTDLSTVYSHYLRKPPSVKTAGHTGLEKNWIPFSDGSPNTLFMLYSDTPRTIFKFTDNGTKLVYESVWAHKSLRCNFGQPRGGAPPVLWRRAATDGALDEYIWFFHTNASGIYHIGAYITVGFQSVRHITPTPLFSGTPQARIVFQCGAIALGPKECPSHYVISAGVHDMDICFLKVPRSQIALVPAELY